MFRRLLFTLVLLLLVGIVSTTATDEGSDDAPTCTPNATLPTGEVVEQTLMHDELERTYLLYVPESADLTQGVPLVMSFHGFASNPRTQMQTSRWNTVADANGFVLAYPQGTGFPLRWNAGENPLNTNPADDVGFVRALIDHLTDDLCLDTTRIYAAGLSNGGGMSNRLACELSDTIAAIGGVAGAYNTQAEGCNPSRPVPVIAFHGTADSIVPYEGTETNTGSLPDIQEWASDWAARNGCDPEPESIPAQGDASGVYYTGCAGDVEVILYTIDEGGHTWPGGEPLPEFIAGKTSQDIFASEVMWDFFMAHPLPE